ncbi:hypothetical protein BCR37DRAFT_394538 [Protomyces lactucae-debilis]|uniref:Uncharacterized protein n=1 Tax=Protomyces lactucae-debilis TaxID=2754530 RepID=A0A1Y2F4I7_PROLT|nr:uncharacterized protein BCR37DRAFT_394538 [Protomyces lactucae-debilis]ORY78597.1 hypothetical protein BCR37DRAFT_394538 [Protomyces lactucae-debilis]
MEKECAQEFLDKLKELLQRTRDTPAIKSDPLFRELWPKAKVLYQGIRLEYFDFSPLPASLLNFRPPKDADAADITKSLCRGLLKDASALTLSDVGEPSSVSAPVATQDTAQQEASSQVNSNKTGGTVASPSVLPRQQASSTLDTPQTSQRSVNMRTAASQSGTPRTSKQALQPVTSSGKSTPVSKAPQASESLKRSATALSKPSMSSASQTEPPKKQQKTEMTKNTDTSTRRQSPTILGAAVNGHAPPVPKTLPNSQVNVKPAEKSLSQQNKSLADDGRRVTRLESELEQMQERLAAILYEQGKKHQAEMEQLEGRLSRSYQLQLEGMEARLEARNQESQTRSLKEFEAKLLTRDTIAPASKSMRSEMNKGMQEDAPSQAALKRLTATTEGLVQELATYKKHVSDHSDLGRKLDLRLQAVTTRTSDASLQRFFSECAAESLTLLKQSQAEALEDRLKRIQQELAGRVDQAEISLREFCKNLSHELQEQPSKNANTNGDLSVNAASAVKIITAGLARLVPRVESVAKDAQVSLETTSKHDKWFRNMSKSITSQQETLHALKKHTSNHHSFMSGLCKTLGFQAQCGEDDTEQAFEMPLLDTIAQRLNGLEKTLEGAQGLLPLAARAKAIADEALRQDT